MGTAIFQICRDVVVLWTWQKSKTEINLISLITLTHTTRSSIIIFTLTLEISSYPQSYLIITNKVIFAGILLDFYLHGCKMFLCTAISSLALSAYLAQYWIYTELISLFLSLCEDFSRTWTSIGCSTSTSFHNVFQRFSCQLFGKIPFLHNIGPALEFCRCSLLNRIHFRIYNFQKFFCISI